MPVQFAYYGPWDGREAKREAIRAKLIAKGLRPDCGKWGVVFMRHARKAGLFSGRC